MSYIHFLSAYNDNIKKSVVLGQFIKSYRLCDEIQFIYKVFQNLDYSNIFIHKCHSIAKSKFYGNKDRVQFNQDSPNVISLPYNKNLDHIKKDLRKTGVDIVFNYPSKISTSIIKNLPDSFSENYETYKIPCHNCNEKYFGETRIPLEQRIKEPKRDVFNGSAIFLHIQEKGYYWDENDIA